MKSLTFLSLLLSVYATTAFVLPGPEFQRVFSTKHGDDPSAKEDLRLIELSPFETRWVTEEDKLELKRQQINFMDITDYQDLGSSARAQSRKTIKYPKTPQFQDVVLPMISNLTTIHMEANLRKFTSFHTRFYNSDYGRESSEWLQGRIGSTAPGIEVKPFKHVWRQSSLIARIPGKTDKIVVVGAHQDSINQYFPLLRAPGADDDGSGTVTILEALRVIFNSEFLSQYAGKFRNTLEFHWYSAEEGGLLGSQAIFSKYEKEGKEVVAMLQQDMTGFVKKTLDAGHPESVGVITDYVDEGLTEFIKSVIEEYCDIPFVETQCGYACSDHASASKAGYPSSFVIESEFRYSDDLIHTSEDKIEALSFNHMLQHAKMTVGFAVELALAEL